MRAVSILTFAALSSAFVIPDEQVLNLQHVEIEPRPDSSILNRLPSKSEVVDRVEVIADYISERFGSVIEKASGKIDVFEDESKHRLEEALSQVNTVASEVNGKIHDSYFDIRAWLESELDNLDNEGVTALFDDHEHPPHHDHPPHDHPPHDGPGHDHPPHDGPPHDGPPHHGPPGPGRKSNLTVYQLISSSKYTTKLAKLINEYDDIVDLLNKTSANFTVFAPTDKAFERIPEHAPKPSKEQLKAVLSYHISPEFYPAGRVLVTRTIPTLLKSDHLGDEPLPQRLSTHIGPSGLTVNFYSRIVAVDIFGTNGVIHGVDHIILPPPSAIQIIDLLPSEFSTLELGLGKTGLLEKLNTTKNHGGTLFAPSNFAFQKLGPKINGFLFSKFGLKYLTALLEYHVVPKHTLYSDAYYKPSSDDKDSTNMFNLERDDDDHHDGPPHRGPPKGFFHVDLPTMLDDRSLSINIFRYGRLIELKINGFSRVSVSDGVAENGVIHVVSDVLIPPKNLNSAATETVNGGEMSLEEFMERLEPYVAADAPEWEDL